MVIEARQRVGGRVNTVPLEHGGHFDAGGEFVSPGHARFLHYADKFGIALENSMFYDAPPRITLGTQVFSAQQTQDTMADIEGVFAKLAQDASTVHPPTPWTAPHAAAWDHMSLKDWLDTQQLAPRSRALMQLYWEAGNGIAIAAQSYLGTLAQVAADAHQVNALRCANGASALPLAFADAIGADRLLLGKPVVAVDCADAVCVTFEDGATLRADWVILATPPGPWQQMRITPAIADDLHPQMGAAVKFVQAFARPATGPCHAFCDAYVTAAWRGTERILVGFAGGPAALRCAALPPARRDAHLKGCVREMVGHPLPETESMHFVDWLAEPFTQGGYSAPAPGQIFRVADRWQQAHHRLFFAGEHTSAAFFGFMEGALQSGEMAAAQVLAALGCI